MQEHGTRPAATLTSTQFSIRHLKTQNEKGHLSNSRTIDENC
jgi:hypothetical protein